MREKNRHEMEENSDRTIRVLVIEDEEQLRLTIGDVLESRDFEVLLAKNGREGVDLALHTEPDVIICDITMPEMDGYEVLKAIRNRAELDLVPFIFLTARHTDLDLRRGMNLGADDYLTKPFHNKDLIDVVHTRLRKIQGIKQALFRHYKMMDDYVYMNSHDIRGPLCNIMGLANLMQQDPELKNHRWTEMLVESTYKLDSVIQRANELLDEEVKMARLENNTHFKE